MTRPAFGRLPRDATEVEALRTDRYLDALLAAADRRASGALAPAALDPGVRRAIHRLRRDLVRVHPSFRFEERLAARLAEAAAAIEGGAPGFTPAHDIAAPELGWDPEVDPAAAMRIPLGDIVRRRQLLIGGAVASAAVSLAGAALVVARRRGRPPVPAMSRAARAVRSGRRSSAATMSRRRSGATRRAPLA
ncbi:MAG TPA: hypothetical protein VFS32_03080 [Candidatus Limnocylindrales bacterium]|nr:hypothetical protein [Candidatus Limnocylindrales bacterium]